MNWNRAFRVVKEPNYKIVLTLSTSFNDLPKTLLILFQDSLWIHLLISVQLFVALSFNLKLLSLLRLSKDPIEFSTILILKIHSTCQAEILMSKFLALFLSTTSTLSFLFLKVLRVHLSLPLTCQFLFTKKWFLFPVLISIHCLPVLWEQLRLLSVFTLWWLWREELSFSLLFRLKVSLMWSQIAFLNLLIYFYWSGISVGYQKPVCQQIGS